MNPPENGPNRQVTIRQLVFLNQDLNRRITLKRATRHIDKVGVDDPTAMVDYARKMSFQTRVRDRSNIQIFS